jgi:hypothetical protein|tara:strand:- start:2774 stop:2992 length:219 start_codon:yes stop_codon:yes gene_type:complete
MDIAIVIYENNEGMNVFPCKNKEIAEAFALAIIQDKRNQHNISKKMSDKEVLKNWDTLTGEMLFIQDVEVIE